MSGLVSLSTSPKALYVYWVATPLGSVSCVSWSSAFQAWVAAVLSAKVVAVLRRRPSSVCRVVWFSGSVWLMGSYTLSD
jgi:hypothetical protein